MEALTEVLLLHLPHQVKSVEHMTMPRRSNSAALAQGPLGAVHLQNYLKNVEFTGLLYYQYICNIKVNTTYFTLKYCEKTHLHVPILFSEVPWSMGRTQDLCYFWERVELVMQCLTVTCFCFSVHTLLIWLLFIWFYFKLQGPIIQS